MDKIVNALEDISEDSSKWFLDNKDKSLDEILTRDTTTTTNPFLETTTSQSVESGGDKTTTTSTVSEPTTSQSAESLEERSIRSGLKKALEKIQDGAEWFSENLSLIHI